MAKSDDILKKYGITQVRGSEGSSDKATPTTTDREKTGTGNKKADDILGKYGITQVRGGDSGSAQEWSDLQTTGSTITGYNHRDALSGWNAFLENQRKKREEEEEKSWLEKIIGYLGQSSPDSTLPMSNATLAAEHYRKDTSYREPMDSWSERQKLDFGFMYQRDPEEAFSYAEELNNRLAMEEKERQKETVKASATDGFWNGAAHTAGALLTSPLGLADYVDDLVEYNARGKITENADLTPFEYSQTVTGGVSQHLNDRYGTISKKVPVLGGKGWGDVYGLGTSVAQSALAGYTGGQLGTLVQFFGSAAAAGVDEAKQRGATDEQALQMGALSGAAEGLAEMIGVDNLLKIGSSATMRQLMKNLVKQGAAEGVEEGITTLMNNFADQWVMKDKSHFNALVRQLMANGMSEEAAKKQAWLTMANDLAFDVVAGFASGVAHAGPQTVFQTAIENVYQPYQAGKAILESEGSVDALKQLANEVAGVSSADTHKDISDQIGKVDEKASALRVGKLYGTVRSANNQANASANQADIAKSLERKGFDPQKAKAVAEALVARYNGQELTKAQEKTLASVKGNTDVKAAISNIVTNAKSTMGQRSDNIRAFNKDVTIGRIAKANSISADQVRKIAEGKMSTKEESLPDSHYEVSADGNATDKDGNIVTIQGIASLDNGRMVLQTENGTVDAKDLRYSSQGEALVYEAVANLEGIIDTNTANKLSKHLMKLGDASSDVYVKGIVQAYTYGYYGYGRDAMTGENTLSATLSEKQRNVAYGLGEQYRDAKTVSDQANAKSATVAKTETTTEAPVASIAGKSSAAKSKQDKWDRVLATSPIFGNATVAKTESVDSKKATAPDGTQYQKVRFEGNVKRWGEKQKAEVAYVDFIASNFSGNTVHVFESYKDKNGKYVYEDSNGKIHAAPNGMYIDSTGDIYLDLNAGNHGEGLMMNTFAHELYHHIQKRSPEKARKLAEFLVQELGYESVEAAVQRQIDKAEKAGHGVAHFMEKGKSRSAAERLVYDRAFNDFVADSLETMFTEGDAIGKLQKLKSQDYGLFNMIKDFINKWVKKLREFYSGHSTISVEGDMVRQLEKFEQIQQMFVEALVDASENYQSSLTPGEEGVAVNQNGDPVAYSTEDGSVLLSMRTYEEEGREEFRKYLQKCVSSKKLTQAEMQEMLEGIEEIYTTCKEFKDKYAPFGSWSDAAVVRDTYGKPVFSVVTPNGDYKMNLDFSLVCKKRRALDAVFNEMSKRGIIDDFELGQKSVVKINEIIRKYGLETACALCFVDAKRFRQASMADSFTSLYNELVLSLVSEDQRSSIDHFNFSGYETIKKVENGIDTWDASKMDFSHIDHVLNTYGNGTVEHKAAKYIKTHPEGRKLLLRGDFMSSQGFDAVKTQNPDVLKLYNSKKGTGGPKAAFGDVQYMNEIIKKARSWTPKKAYAVGGVRIQSFSDYVPRMVFDYVQMVYDLAATKLPAHAYTKEAMFAKQFGLTGIKINMSLIPAIAEGGVAPGLDANGNYVWAGESFDFETAKEIQKAEGYTENCGTICVGVSDRHIRKLLSDPDIRMVIPYHKSGLNPIVAHMNKIAEFTDYTNKQNTTVKETGAKAEKHFDFNQALHDMGEDADPKAVIQQYFDWCDDNGYDPKFAEFRDHPNYYKLIEDFTLFDKDGRYVPQREVRAVFPKEGSVFGSMKDLIKAGLEEDAIIEGKKESGISSIVDEIQQTLPKTEAEIAETQVAQADRDLESLDGTMLSDRDYSYEALVSKPDMVVTEVGGNVPTNRADIVAVAKKNATSVGRFDPKTGSVSVHVKDIGKDVVLGTVGLKHGLDGRRTDNAIVTVKAGEILRNSIRINELTPKKEEAYGSYVLIGAARGSNGDLYIVRSVVNTFKHELVSMDVLYAINAKKGNRLRSMRPGFQGPVTDSTISIAELLDYVNQYFPDILPEEVLKHYGYDARPEGSLGEDALYSDRDSDGNTLTKAQSAYFAHSKVRDADGNLMVMYHGTANGGAFTVFDGNQLGNEARTSQVGQGFYFTNAKAEAESYTINVDIYGRTSKGKNPYLHQVYLNITNPFNVTEDTLNLDDVKAVYGDGTEDYFFDNWIPFYLNRKSVNGEVLSKAAVQAMSKEEKTSIYVDYLAQFGTKELLSNMVRAFPYGKQSELLAAMQNRLGYDGIVEEYAPGKYQYVAFSSEQVKATDNQNPTSDPDIRYSDRDNAPTFYSHMARVVDGVKQEKLGAASVVSMLRGKGVKAEEIKWSGIETWLEGKKSVTKAELQEFIAGSMLQIEEDMLTDQEIPYSQEHLDQISKFEAERDIIAENLKSEWKRIVGTDIPITYFGAGLESAVVQNLLLANNEKKGNTESGYKYKAKRAALQRVIEDGDHYFGFDNARQAFREALRNPKDFMTAYEMTSFEKGVFRDFIKAKEEYGKVEGISVQDQKALIAIAESADRFSNRINQVKTEHRAEAAKYLHKYRSYTINGGTNYRELLFRIPGSTYSNTAMDVHWERSGVLAHARMQDLNTFLGKMLFIEEIQSDWHNEGHKSGYRSEEARRKAEAARDAYRELKQKLRNDKNALISDLAAFYQSIGYDTPEKAAEHDLQWNPYKKEFYRSIYQAVNMPNGLMERIEAYQSGLDRMHDLGREEFTLKNEYEKGIPDAPFKDTYHEYVLKRLIRMAAEQDYDSIGWTPADIQVKRWSEEFAEGYRIEYDQDIPKFLNKYGKKWGTRVGKTTLDSGTEIWSMAITDEMKESVLTEGQPLYSDRIDTSGMDSEATKIIRKLEIRAIGSRYDKGKYASYSAERIERELYRSSATKMDYAKSYIAWVNPEDFLYATTTSQAGRDQIEKEAGDLDLDRLRKETQPIHLTVDFETGKIVGHEGRHRMTALYKAGVEKVAVIFDAWNDDRYNTKPVNMMEIVGQEFDRYHSGIGFYVHDMLPLSRRYADATRKLFSEVGGSIKFSERSDDSVSNRSLLANAFEGVAQNDIERNKIQEYKGKISLINAEERKLSELNEKIKELSFAKGPKDTKAIRDLQFEARQAANRINTYDKQLLRLEASKPLQDILTREKKLAYQKAEKKGKEALAAYKERAAKTQRDLMDKWQESRKRGIESREKTAMRHKIQSVVGELNQLLLSNDKKRHVPDSLKKAVADALALVNMDTVGAEERAAKYAALIAKETDPDKIDAYTVTMENILRQGDKMGQRLRELRDAYEEIQESDDPDIANAYDPVIAGSLKELAQSIGNTSLRNMTIEQLSDVYDMYKMVLTRVRDANKSFLNEKKEAISNLASRVVGEVRRAGGEHKYRAAFLDFARKFGWNNLKPVYAFEHIGSSTLADAFKKVRDGEDVWAIDVTEARAYYLDKSKKYGYDSWDFKKKYRFESASGLEFDLTLDQILSLYAYSKREQAHDHLKLGGFVFDSNIETYTEKGSKLVKYRVNTADAHQITPDILASIISKLTGDQMGFVDEMQDYLSTVMGAKGNEVTMKMYGVKLFKEKFYFPLKSAKQFMFEQNEVSGEVKIKNSGFTNKVVAKANNPVILSNFMDVWSGHVNDMSMYHAFVLPLEDFNRIFNYNSPKQEGTPPVSVKGTIQSAYTPAAVNYVRQLITDLNGGARTDPTTDIISKMMGLFKKGAVFASLSVVVQQPSAVARAAALVDTKYFIGPKVDHKRHKALWDEVKKYAPVAIIKEMGYFDTNMGKSTQDFIQGKEYSGFNEKMKALVTDSNYRDEALSKAPALADEIAWCSIWEAVKREMHDKHKGLDVKSEPFLMLCGGRFTEVITKTQVYDSVLSRSGLMRSKDTGMKMATAFMAEPTTSINMIADALLQGKRGNRKYCRAAIGAVVASQILNSILVSFVYAGRDDDEDETYAEKYIGTLTGEILDSLNPAGYIPFVKDIMSIVQGYDVERSDMAVISDLWNAYQKLGSDKLSVYRKVEGFAGSIAQIFGLPVKNIMRDVRGIYQTIMSFVNGQQTTKSGIGYAVKESIPGWMGGGDISNQQQLYEAYLRGDQAHISRVKSRFKDQTAIDSAIRKALRENDPRIKEAAIAWNANDLDEYMRLAKAIIAEKHFSQDNVVMAIRAEASALEPGAETSSTSKAKGLFTAEKFAEAIAQGDEATAYASRIDIIQTEQKNGKTEAEAEKSFVSSAKSELKELFVAGGISEDKAVSALIDYCGIEEQDAMADVQYWAFKNEYPDVYADDAWFDKYYQEIADTGIPVDVYMNYRNEVKNITGDGKKERRMAVIDSLPITSAQKDAMYFAEGWAASTLNEAPWH